MACDVSDKKHVEYFGDEAINQWQNADVLVNNAGDFLPGSVYNEQEGTL